MTTHYKLKEPWPAVPNTLEICQDAQQIGTTYERLAKHLVVFHKEEYYVVDSRSQVELEAMHDRLHQKNAAKPCGHKHARPVRIVGYEIKDEPQPPVFHKFPFPSLDTAAAFVKGLAVFGAITNFLVPSKKDKGFVIYDESRGWWVVTIRGDIPGYETYQPDINNEIWHEEQV